MADEGARGFSFGLRGRLRSAPDFRQDRRAELCLSLIMAILFFELRHVDVTRAQTLQRYRECFDRDRWQVARQNSTADEGQWRIHFLHITHQLKHAGPVEMRPA